MFTRSVQRVMQLVAWMNAAWRSSFRQICSEHRPLFLWLGWHHSLKFCYYILSLIYRSLSDLTVISNQRSSVLAVFKPDSDSRPFAWCVRPLHMHRRIIMSYNLVTEIKKKLTRSTFGTQIAFHRDMTSKIQICLFVCPLTQDPSPRLCLNPISIWWLAGEAILRGKSLQVQQASLSGKITNEALPWVQGRVYSFSTAVSQNLASYDYFLLRKSLAAFAIFWGQCRDTP